MVLSGSEMSVVVMHKSSSGGILETYGEGPTAVILEAGVALVEFGAGVRISQKGVEQEKWACRLGRRIEEPDSEWWDFVEESLPRLGGASVHWTLAVTGPRGIVVKRFGGIGVYGVGANGHFRSVGRDDRVPALVARGFPREALISPGSAVEAIPLSTFLEARAENEEEVTVSDPSLLICSRGACPYDADSFESAGEFDALAKGERQGMKSVLIWMGDEGSAQPFIDVGWALEVAQ